MGIIDIPELEIPEGLNFSQTLIYVASLMAHLAINDSTPFGRRILQGLNVTKPNRILDPLELAKYIIRYPGQEGVVYQQFEAHGYNREMADALTDLSRAILGPDDIIRLSFRENWANSKTHMRLWKAGIHGTEIEDLIKARRVYPGIQDIITFAVREVYSPTIRQAFRLDEDRPKEFDDEAERLGMDAENASKYWAAHWQLPSVGQAFEMFHRTTDNSFDENTDTIELPSGKTTHNVIGYETLQQLLRANDYMPAFRKPLTQIAYNPLTRVDVRRMYALGVLDIDGVYRNYLNAGYNPENAALMTEFTVKYESREFDGITRANIINSYKDEVIDRSEMIELFRGIGMSDRARKFWVAQANYEKTENEVKQRVDDLVELYRLGDIESRHIRKELSALDLPSKYVDRVINDTIRDQAKKRQVPPKSDLIKWFEMRIITEREFFDKMSLLGFRDEDIYNYMTQIMIESEDPQRKYLSEKTYQRWLQQEIITVDYFANTLAEMGVSESDIETYIIETETKSEPAKK